MIRDIGVHRAYDAEIVNAAADLRKNLADLDSALAEFLKRKRRRKGGTGASFGLQSDGDGFAGEPGERRLWVESIDM